MRRWLPTLVALSLFLTVGYTHAWAQRSGSMQATALVVDTRAATSGLESAQELAADWAQDPTRSAVETRYARISLVPTALSGDARPESELQIRVDYLRN